MRKLLIGQCPHWARNSRFLFLSGRPPLSIYFWVTVLDVWNVSWAWRLWWMLWSPLHSIARHSIIHNRAEFLFHKEVKRKKWRKARKAVLLYYILNQRSRCNIVKLSEDIINGCIRLKFYPKYLKSWQVENSWIYVSVCLKMTNLTSF